jgi:hypothetical protein
VITAQANSGRQFHGNSACSSCFCTTGDDPLQDIGEIAERLDATELAGSDHKGRRWWLAFQAVIQSPAPGVFCSISAVSRFPCSQFSDSLRQTPGGFAMSQGLRLLLPDREQLRWDTIDLDSQLPPEHRTRLVWAFVETLDLTAFYARIEARDDLPGRPAAEPAVLLALWLYATLDGVGSARAIERLCEHHAAYR